MNYNDGTLWFKTNYINNQRYGYYHENHNINYTTIIYYARKNHFNSMIKHILTHHPNYNLKSYIEYHNDIPYREENYDEQGKLHGIYKEWDSKGNLYMESNLIHGILNGDHKEYYSNKILKTHKIYLNGKLDGITTEYYSSGVIRSQDSYKYERTHGPQKTFYANGQLCTEIKYIQGKRNGVMKQYTEDGELMQWRTYKDDVLVNSKQLKPNLVQEKTTSTND